MDNATQFFDLKTRIKEMKQGTMSVNITLNYKIFDRS